jgi:hypothetical protein
LGGRLISLQKYVENNVHIFSENRFGTNFKFNEPLKVLHQGVIKHVIEIAFNQLHSRILVAQPSDEPVVPQAFVKPQFEILAVLQAVASDGFLTGPEIVEDVDFNTSN